MKRPRHIRSTLAVPVSIAVLYALASSTAPNATPRWSVLADSAATPPMPMPLPAPLDTARAPAPAPAPAPADTVRVPPPPAPAPADTTKVPPSIPPPTPQAVDTTKAVAPPSAPTPVPAPVPSVSPPSPPPAPPPLTKKQRRAQEKAAKLAKHPQKVADADSLAQWNKGRNWISVRGGYAKSGGSGSASGSVGAALGISHFLSSRWSLGLYGQGDLLGKFAGSAEIEYPITLELVRHFRWRTALRPYLGLGTGAYYHKFFRTGADTAAWKSGGYLVGGFNAPIGQRSVLGIDARVQFVSGDPGVRNPVFGDEPAQLTHYSVKLGYSRTF